MTGVIIMQDITYINRILDEQLSFYLETFGAVLLRGPKWCGKTTTAERKAKSVIKMQDKKRSKDYILAAQTDLSIILNGESPRLIDEWQVEPSIWDAVRTSVDEEKKKGMYILTGSRVPAENSYQHSGAGRIGKLIMYTMSLFESGDSNGSISLKDLFDCKSKIDGIESQLTIPKLVDALCRGGWPDNQGDDYKKCALKLRSYLDLIYESDDLSLKKYAKNVDVAKNIVRSYSRNISTLAETKSIYQDVLKNDINISESQIYDYINALENVYIIEDVPAWNPSLRSKTVMRSTPKREITDPSIAALSLGITPYNYVDDFRIFGFLFESLCIRDLRIYSSSLDGKVYYYRDRYGLEADAVVLLDDGRYGIIEIKLGSTEIEKGSANLCELERIIGKSGLRRPSFKMVLTGGSLAYTRKDGVIIVPIGCLKN
jgi:uncharacterized protein